MHSSRGYLNLTTITFPHLTEFCALRKHKKAHRCFTSRAQLPAAILLVVNIFILLSERDTQKAAMRFGCGSNESAFHINWFLTLSILHKSDNWFNMFALRMEWGRFWYTHYCNNENDSNLIILMIMISRYELWRLQGSDFWVSMALWHVCVMFQSIVSPDDPHLGT